jgi:hypothetical protein
MSLDQPASSQAFWQIYDSCQIRPEWLIPSLAIESGLNPGIPNAAGFSYYGISQLSGTYIQNVLGVTPDVYLTWPASQQLLRGVLPYMQANVKMFGPLLSGIRVYQANFYPASLKYAKTLDSTIVAAPSAAYEANQILDPSHDGRITPRDLATVLTKQVAKPYVVAAIAACYAVRPFEHETDPVFGIDFSPNPLVAFFSPGLLQTVLTIAGIGVVTGLITNAIDPRILPRWARI